MTNVVRVLAAAYARAGNQIETRTRAHCIPSSASFLYCVAPKPKERSIALLRLVDQIENAGGMADWKHSRSDFVVGFEVIQEEDFSR